ncbi:unnamed protein product [Didymodactylos carnosus]|uniref:Kelch repeat-containing protein n=1 Tax=Didymodactylos carnosus TaxID=1234261 RepID=A0A814VGV6_9BILA|nr:unnamed protein product [Didymodactylos carnosus]CAF1188259.1 unnamed protein product [Didymodactylos carnosus]CAF3901556.1 unnamed protein product [Didymodactylos carnosus]CAF3952527.1 unnamed protein product [Didymodactylos carnosus]
MLHPLRRINEKNVNKELEEKLVKQNVNIQRLFDNYEKLTVKQPTSVRVEQTDESNDLKQQQLDDGNVRVQLLPQPQVQQQQQEEKAGSITDVEELVTDTTTESIHDDRNTASVLTNGKVLLTGGVIGNDANHANIHTTSAELYDPSTGPWTATGNMNDAQSSHRAPVLENEKALVSAGIGGTYGLLNSDELFNPSTGTWTTIGYLNNERYWQTATVLTNGKVLVTGGAGMGDLSSAELYDP